MPIDLNEHLKRKKEQLGNADKDSKSDENKENKNNWNRGGGGGNGGGNKGGFGSNLSMPEFKMPGNKSLSAIIAIVVIILILIVARPFVIINSGEVGIKVTAGKYDNTPLQPGFHFFVPLLQEVIVVDTKVRTINFSRTEDMGVVGQNQGIFRNDAISVMDSRGLSVSIELTVQYQLNALTAPQTIANYGLSWEQKIINPVVRDVVRSVVGRYPAEELPVKRNDIATLIASSLTEEIGKSDNTPVMLSSVQLREIVLPQNIKDQIEKVQVARQEAERVRYEVDRAKQEAEKVAALAKGEADANRVRAQGVADAVTIEAKAQSQANMLISNSLSNRLLDLRQIETQGKFNEALKVNQNAQIFLTPGGAVPNIWVDSKNKQRSAAASGQ